VKAHRGRDDEREVVLRLRARDLDSAKGIADEIHESMPPGYAHLHTSFKREHGKGRQHSVTVVIIQNDSREHTLSLNEAVDLWSGLED